MNAEQIVERLTTNMRDLVRLEVAAAVAASTSNDLVAHIRIDVPHRVSCAACASGEVEGAKKIGKRWIAPRSSWGAWLDRASTRGDDVFADVDAAIARRTSARAN